MTADPTLLDRITINPAICMGKPCLRGRRLTVEFILELLAEGWQYEELQQEYDLAREDILAVLAYAKQIIEEEQVYKIPAKHTKSHRKNEDEATNGT